MAVTTEDEAVALLSAVPVFETRGTRELARIAQLSVPRRFDAGQVVFREGDSSDTCYIVRRGHARAIREHPDGRSITLATFGPGDFFGELAMFDDERRSATIEAVDALEVVAILGRDVRRLRRDNNEITVKLVTALGRRLRAANERLSRQSFQTVQSRVAAVLDQLVEQARAEGEAGRGHVVGPRGGRGGPARRAGHGDSGRAGPARRLFARVGVALPGRARAGGGDQPGPRAADRPRPRGAAWVCLLSASAPTAGSSSATARCSSSPPPGGRGCGPCPRAARTPARAARRPPCARCGRRPG